MCFILVINKNKTHLKEIAKKIQLLIFTNKKEDMSLQVQIMTPDRIFLKEEAEEIILPTNTGQIGILKNHAPIITALDIGVMLMRSKNEWIPLALMGGFALVKQNQVTVLVNEALRLSGSLISAIL